jgi:hypothetical protein
MRTTFGETGGGFLKETVGSLRLYFVIVGVVSGLLNITGFARGVTVLGVVLLSVGLVLSAGYLYVGIRMRAMLLTSPVRIQQLLYANTGLVVINAANSLVSGYTRGLVQAGVTLAITVYLLFSVRRLAAEMASEVAPAGAEEA